MIQATAFGPWLKHSRKAQGLTQKELAQRIGCATMTVVKIEAGERRPSKQIAELLARSLAISADEHALFVEFARADLPSDLLDRLTLDNPQAPWRGLHRRPNNLPAQPTPFIGREAAVAAACAILREPGTRLLTLTGSPGIGKTRLGLRVAAELNDTFEDGVFFVALAPITDPSLLYATIASAFSVQANVGEPLVERLHAHLREKEMLLLLDNFEQIITAGPQVAQLLHAAAGLKIVITSRTVAHLYGEHEFPVHPLTLPDPHTLPAVEQMAEYEAIRLFTERAVATKIDFALDEENAPTLTGICARLDGVPLAIELAAARVKTLSPEAILARLEHTLDVLVGGPQDQSARQQTLRGAIDWSYDLLDPVGQRLFRTLGAFVGGWSIESAQKVCQEFDIPVDGTAMADELDALAGQSLLLRGTIAGDIRYTMLETIRAYAVERLAGSGEAAEISRRHADHFLGMAERAEQGLRGPEQKMWLDRLETEQANLRAALRWVVEHAPAETGLRFAGALVPFWNSRGYSTEGREWLTSVLARVEAEPSTSAPTAARAKVLAGVGRLARLQGEHSIAQTFYEQSLTLSREIDDRAGIAEALNGLGLEANWTTDYALSRVLLSQSLEMFREIGDKHGMADVLGGLVDLTRVVDDQTARRAFAEERLVIARELGDTAMLAWAIGNLGAVAADQNDNAPARALFEESLALHRALGQQEGIAWSLIALGEVARQLEDYVSARNYYAESLELYRKMGYRLFLGWPLHNLGHVERHEGEYGQAMSYFSESLTTFQDQGDMQGVAACLAGMAGVVAPQGHLERAAQLSGAAVALLESTDTRLDTADRTAFDRTLETVRVQLDEAIFVSAWSAGQALPFDEAIAVALTRTGREA